MARWLCNAELPGSFLQGRGIVKTGQEFTTPDDPEDPFFERAREKWLPRDAAAEKLVEKAKKDAQKMAQDNAKEAARRRQLDEDARNGTLTRMFETKPDAIGQHFGLNRASETPQGEEEQKRNEAWAKQFRKEQKKDDSSELRDTVHEVVREQQAIAGGAPAQPVADPNAVAPAPANNKKK